MKPSGNNQSVSPSATVDIVYNNRYGNLNYNTGNNRITLKSGKRYKLSAGTRVDASNSSYATAIRFYDHTNGDYIDGDYAQTGYGSRALVIPTTFTSNICDEQVTYAMIQPSTDIDISVRLVNAAQNAIIISDNDTWVIIEEITGHYFFGVKPTGNNQNVGSGTSTFDIAFNNRYGSLSYNAGNDRITLKANKTYKLEADIRIDSANNAYAAVVSFYDHTNGETIQGSYSKSGYGSRASKVPVTDTTPHTSNAQVSTAIITPDTDIDVSVRLTGNNQNVVVYSDSDSWVSIEEIYVGADYFYGVKPSGNDQSVGSGTSNFDIKFNARYGSLSYNDANDRITLNANKLYVIIANGRIDAANSSYAANLYFYDHTNGELIFGGYSEPGYGTRALVIPNTYAASHICDDRITTAVIAPTTNIDISYRLVSNSQNVTVVSDNDTWIAIKEIGITTYATSSSSSPFESSSSSSSESSQSTLSSASSSSSSSSSSTSSSSDQSTSSSATSESSISSASSVSSGSSSSSTTQTSSTSSSSDQSTSSTATSESSISSASSESSTSSSVSSVSESSGSTSSTTATSESGSSQSSLSSESTASTGTSSTATSESSASSQSTNSSLSESSPSSLTTSSSSSSVSEDESSSSTENVGFFADELGNRIVDEGGDNIVE